MTARWPSVEFRELLRRNSRPHLLGATQDAALVGMRLYGQGPFFRELKKADRIAKKSHFVIRAGDVIYNKLFAWKGAFGIVTPDLDGMYVSDKFPTYELDTARLDPNFLRWYFRHSPLWDAAKNLSTGSAALSKLTLNPPRFLELRIPLPALAEQQRIAALLSTAQAAIEKLVGCQEAAASDARSLFPSALEKLLRPAEASGRIGDILQMRPRSGPSFVTSAEWRGTAVLMPSSVSGFGVDISRVEYGIGNERISPKDILEPGDVLIARGNKKEQVGNAGVVPAAAKGWVCANLLMRMQVDPKKADPWFLAYWLQCPTMRQIVRTAMSGTNPNIQKINQQKILAFPFPAHFTVRRQQEIVRQADMILDRVKNLQTLRSLANDESQQIMPSLVARAFSTGL